MLTRIYLILTFSLYAIIMLSQEQNCITILESNSLQVFCNKIDASGFDKNDGLIKAEVIGGTPPYAFIWNTGATIQTLNNLTKGYYDVTVTDAKGCKSYCYNDIKESKIYNQEFCIEILEPQKLNLNCIKIDISAYGRKNGQASVLVNGGTTPYSYNWSNGLTTETILGLEKGHYIITVTDAKKCKTYCTVEILEPEPTCVGNIICLPLLYLQRNPSN